MIYFSKYKDIRGYGTYVIVSTDENINAKYIEVSGGTQLVYRQTDEVLEYTELDLAFDGGVVIKTNSDGLFAPIKSKSCSITYVTDKLLLDFYQLSPQQPTVKVYRVDDGWNHPMFWGYVTPASYNQAYNSVNPITIECCDAISSLKYYRYNEKDTVTYVSIKDFIDDAVKKTNMYTHYYFPRTINIQGEGNVDTTYSNNHFDENGDFVGDDYIRIVKNNYYTTSSPKTLNKYTIVFDTISKNEYHNTLLGGKRVYDTQIVSTDFEIGYTTDNKLYLILNGQEYRFDLNPHIKKHVLKFATTLSFPSKLLTLGGITIDGIFHGITSNNNLVNCTPQWGIGTRLDYINSTSWDFYTTDEGKYTNIYYFENSNEATLVPSLYEGDYTLYNLKDSTYYLMNIYLGGNDGFIEYIPLYYDELDIDKLLVNQQLFIDGKTTYYGILEEIAKSFCLSVTTYDRGVYFIDYQALVKGQNHFWHYDIGDNTKEDVDRKKDYWIEGQKHNHNSNKIHYASSDITLSIDDVYNKIKVKNKLKAFTLIDQNDLYKDYTDITANPIEGKQYAELTFTHTTKKDDEETTTTYVNWYRWLCMNNANGECLSYGQFYVADGEQDGIYDVYERNDTLDTNTRTYTGLEQFQGNHRYHAYNYQVAPMKYMYFNYVDDSDKPTEYDFENVLFFHIESVHAYVTHPKVNTNHLYPLRAQFISNTTVFNGGYVALDYRWLLSLDEFLVGPAIEQYKDATFTNRPMKILMWIEDGNGTYHFKVNNEDEWYTLEELKTKYQTTSVHDLQKQYMELPIKSNKKDERIGANTWLSPDSNINFFVDDAPSGCCFKLPKDICGKLCVQFLGGIHNTWQWVQDGNGDTFTSLDYYNIFIKDFKATVFKPIDESLTNLDNMKKNCEYSNITYEDYIVEENTTELMLTSQPNNKYYSMSSIIYNKDGNYMFIPLLQSRMFPKKVHDLRLEEYIINKKLSHYGQPTVIVEGSLIDHSLAEPMPPYVMLYESNLQKWLLVDSMERDCRTNHVSLKMVEYGDVLDVNNYEVTDVEEDE